MAFRSPLISLFAILHLWLSSLSAVQAATITIETQLYITAGVLGGLILILAIAVIYLVIIIVEYENTTSNHVTTVTNRVPTQPSSSRPAPEVTAYNGLEGVIVSDLQAEQQMNSHLKGPHESRGPTNGPISGSVDQDRNLPRIMTPPMYRRRPQVLPRAVPSHQRSQSAHGTHMPMDAHSRPYRTVGRINSAATSDAYNDPRAPPPPPPPGARPLPRAYDPQYGGHGRY